MSLTRLEQFVAPPPRPAPLRKVGARAGLSRLIQAIDDYDAPTVEAMLMRLPQLAQERAPAEHAHDQSLLHRAIPSDGIALTHADLPIVTSLLEVASGSMGGALAWAVTAGIEAAGRLLLDRGLDLSHPNRREALHLAAEHDRADIVRLLTLHGADTGAADGEGKTARDRAAPFGNSDGVLVLATS